MQHYKQFVTMIKVYGVEEMTKVVTDKLENNRLKKIDKEYKEYVSEDIPKNLSEDEKIETIKKGYVKHIENLFDVLTQFGEKNCNKSNNVLKTYNKIKDSDNIEDVQKGLKQILSDIKDFQKQLEEKIKDIQKQLEEKIKDYKVKYEDNLEELDKKINKKLNIQKAEWKVEFLIKTFEAIIDKNITIKKFYEQSVQYLYKADYKEVIKVDKYKKIYDSVKEQIVTQDEKEKAETYKKAYLEHVSIDDDETAYYHNPIEVEAYTVQAEAALKKLEEYNKRHEES